MNNIGSLTSTSHCGNLNINNNNSSTSPLSNLTPVGRVRALLNRFENGVSSNNNSINNINSVNNNNYTNNNYIASIPANNYIASIPADVLLNIFSRLSVLDLIHVGRTCRYFNQITHSDPKYFNVGKKGTEKLRKLLQKSEPIEKVKNYIKRIAWLIKTEGFNLAADDVKSLQKVLQKASLKGHAEVVKLLLADSRVDPSTDDNYAIQWASLNGHAEVVQLLLTDSRVDPSADNNQAIQWASQNGHAGVVKALLGDSRVNPSAANNFAIRMASSSGHVEVVKLLLTDPRVEPSADKNYAIRLANEYGHTEIVKLLRADPRTNLDQ